MIGELKIFSGTAHPELAEEIAKQGMDVLLYAQRGHFFSDNQDSYRSQFNYGSNELNGIKFLMQNYLHSDFSMKEAVKDHIELIKRFAGDYEHVGQFGFSTGAIISAKSLEDPVVNEKTEGLYFASPYLSVERLRLPKAAIRYMKKHKSNETGLLSGISSIAHYDLQDIDVDGKPVRVAIAEQDEITRSNEDVEKFREKGWRANVFPGGHVFITDKYNEADLYLGKAFQWSPYNEELYSDIIGFFAAMNGK